MKETNYINVDLEIESNEDLSPIIDEFGNDIIVLYNDYNKSNNTYTLVAESTFDYKFRNPDELINCFYFKINKFSSETRRLWDNCNQRVFNIGYGCILTTVKYESEIKSLTIKNVSELGAAIKITIYPSKTI
ncbi:MAG: hypothetical protein PVI90_04210 [Desulfobacteraceae bacterium]|jgi:hypothetical protein